MPPAFRYQNATRLLVGVTVASSAVLGAVYYRTWIHAPGIYYDSMPATATQSFQTSFALTGTEWQAVQSRPGKQPVSGPGRQASEHYRLAGTFFIEGAGEPQRRAILDSAAKREQFIVSEGERLDDLTVERIYFDHVTLRGPSGSQDIWVEFASKAPVIDSNMTSNPAALSAGGTNKFGCIQTEENRWKFNRKPLLNYYQELLDEPDRMVAVFDTMKPVRDERNKITGYVVGIEGEKDFFDAVGLRQGDIVRAVNSLPMTNRRRAEAFIDQFLKDKMNAVVLEVERGGKVTKQVYQMQP
jgi:type II secretory pathway component PulC